MEGGCGVEREAANKRAASGQVLALEPLEHKQTHRVVPILKQKCDFVTPGSAIHQLPTAH